MKRNMVITLMTTILVVCWITTARADDFNQESYVKSVIVLLRIHADSISNLSTHKIKYSDNLVRHAIDLQRTFGLLGPMDWHAANAVKLVSKNAAKLDMDEQQFDDLARRSRNAMRALIVAAQDAMVEDNREGVKEALQNVKDSCNACHSYLPASVAPDVWGTLKRK